MSRDLPPHRTYHPETVMLTIDGREFWCDCNCNCFHRPYGEQPNLYRCNACGDDYETAMRAQAGEDGSHE